MPTIRLFFPLIAILFPMLLIVSGCSSSNSGQPTPPDQNDAPPKNVVIRGTVQDQNGNPVSGVLVVPEPKEELSVPIPEIAVYTDEQGKFTWNLPPGEYDFVLTQNERNTDKHTVTIPQDQNEHELNLVFKQENK